MLRQAAARLLVGSSSAPVPARAFASTSARCRKRPSNGAHQNVSPSGFPTDPLPGSTPGFQYPPTDDGEAFNSSTRHSSRTSSDTSQDRPTPRPPPSFTNPPSSASPSPSTNPPPPPAHAELLSEYPAVTLAPPQPIETSEGVLELPRGPDGKIDLSRLPSLNLDPEAALPEPEREGQGRRERTNAGKKEYVSSIEQRRRNMVRLGVGATLVGGAVWVYKLSREDGSGAVQGDNGWQRLKNNLSEKFDYFNKPAFKTLLPDPLPAPHQRPYTLLIDLEGMLVSSSWDRTQGWRTAKRPGVDYFLAYLSQFYEIVLFTSQPVYTAATVAEKLDPYQAYLPYKLFRESTRYIDGKVVKDLSYLNRDLSKVILLDTNAEHAALQPDNAVIIKPWDGASNDRGLIEMIPFLESFGIFSIADVRPVLKNYQGKNIPVEFAKVEAAAKQKAVEEWNATQRHSSYGARSGLIGGLLGGLTPAQARPQQPMTYLEQRREQAQKMYKEEQKYWAEHADEFQKLIDEDKAKQLAEMKGSVWSYLSGSGAGAGPGVGASPGLEAKK